MTASKIVAAAASGAGGDPVHIENVFSVDAYIGNNSNRTITTNVDMSSDGGGLVIVKDRDAPSSWIWSDTERGANKQLTSHAGGAQTTHTDRVTGFTSAGFTLGTNSEVNNSSAEFCAWTFKKAEKFFDCIAYTGNGASNRAIPHNLKDEVGMVIVKRYNNSENWAVWHRIFGTNDVIYLDQTSNKSVSNAIFGTQKPDNDNVYVGNHPASNSNGDSYVMYIFAHNDGTGEFGIDGDLDIIKCGSFSGTGNKTIDLGFEPEFVMIKNYGGTDSGSRGTHWMIQDSRRGTAPEYGDSAGKALRWNASSAEHTDQYCNIYDRGFQYAQSSSAPQMIYMAVRRGPSSAPEHGDESFAMERWNNGPPAYTAPFAVDMFMHRDTTGGGSWEINNKLFQGKKLFTNQTAHFASSGNQVMDFQDGAWDSSATLSNYQAWMWQNRPKFFESTVYLGDGTTNRTHTHNLQAEPKMIWVKRLSNQASTRNGDAWHVYHAGVDASNPENYYLVLEGEDARNSDNAIWQQTKPTATNWYTGTSDSVINHDGQPYFLCLFAELDGVTKVGSYTMPSSGSLDVDCGFSNGTRFLIIKSTAQNEWMVFDTSRGFPSGDDPYMRLNKTNAQTTGTDFIDALSSGFTVNATGASATAQANQTYVFYAIAAQ